MTLSNSEKQKRFRERQKPYVRIAARIKLIEDSLYDLHDSLVLLLTEIEQLKKDN